MTTHKEALKLARQLLWRYRHETPIGRQPHMICQEVDEAFERIDEALAQPEQEPVAWCEQSELDWLNSDKRGASAYVKTMLSKRKDAYAQTPLYTTPPQRTWVGLTDEEMTECIVSICNTDDGTGNTRDLIRAVEAKLKEKNT